jgi:energy-converting hydrogenase Eha subunit H
MLWCSFLPPLGVTKRTLPQFADHATLLAGLGGQAIRELAALAGAINYSPILLLAGLGGFGTVRVGHGYSSRLI